MASYERQLRARAEAIATVCVHEETGPDGELDTPIVMSSAFAFSSAEEARQAFTGDGDAWIYGRWGNPTIEALEHKLARIEAAETACVTASGMAAIAGTILASCVSGDHIVAPRSMYGESARFMRERLPRLGITTTFVDASPEAYAAATTPSTRLYYIETPSNPMLDVIDLAGIRKAAGDRVVAVDSTFATPFSQNALAHGADLVVHSMTKAIGGHGDVIGGVVAGSKARVDAVRDMVVKGFGGALAPMSAWLILRGLRTLAIRQERACATAAEIASRLATRVSKVHHPSLPSHPGHEIAKRQMHAFGSILSFEVESVERGRKVLESLRVATHAVSLGDVRTLVVHPASTTHSTMPADIRRAAGIHDGLLRMSCGLEGLEDLWADLSQALG